MGNELGADVRDGDVAAVQQWHDADQIRADRVTLAPATVDGTTWAAQSQSRRLNMVYRPSAMATIRLRLNTNPHSFPNPG